MHSEDAQQIGSIERDDFMDTQNREEAMDALLASYGPEHGNRDVSYRLEHGEYFVNVFDDEGKEIEGWIVQLDGQIIER